MMSKSLFTDAKTEDEQQSTIGNLQTENQKLQMQLTIINNQF